MELTYPIDERPSAFAAACAPVSGAALSYALRAPGAPQAQAVPQAQTVTQTQTQTQVWSHEINGRGISLMITTNGFAVMDLLTGKPVGAVRGVPPRGRPV